MDFKTDINGDIAIENGDFVLVTGVEATIQFIVQSLRLFAAEWFLDETKGVPYFDEVFLKNPNPVSVDTLFKKKIISLPGVLELQQFSMEINPATRVLDITGRIRAFDGEADFSVSTIVPEGA